MAQRREFAEIARCGGEVILRAVTNDGQRSYQWEWRRVRPPATAVVALYAFPPGIPVGPINLDGYGDALDARPVSGSVPVFLAGDSEGKFAHECRACGGYWRSQPWPRNCPYCGFYGERQPEFLTKTQRLYVRHYCRWLSAALATREDGEQTLDLDTLAEAIRKEAERPPFYSVPLSRRNLYTCEACGTFNDIFGTYAYCSGCGTRNDQQLLATRTMPAIRKRSGGRPDDAGVREAVAAFRGLVERYAGELARLIPMTKSRRARLERLHCHGLGTVAEELKSWFDIDMLDGLNREEAEFAAQMFEQAESEARDAVCRLAELVTAMAANLHRGFHAIFPADEGRMQKHRGSLRKAAGAEQVVPESLEQDQSAA